MSAGSKSGGCTKGMRQIRLHLICNGTLFNEPRTQHGAFGQVLARKDVDRMVLPGTSALRDGAPERRPSIFLPRHRKRVQCWTTPALVNKSSTPFPEPGRALRRAGVAPGVDGYICLQKLTEVVFEIR